MTKKGQHKAKIGKKEIVEQDNKNVTTTPQQDEEEEVNSGFSNYLRSSTGQEMLKMFVVVNSIVVFLTIAWPQMKTSYEYLEELYREKFGSVEFTELF